MGLGSSLCFRCIIFVLCHLYRYRSRTCSRYLFVKVLHLLRVLDRDLPPVVFRVLKQSFHFHNISRKNPEDETSHQDSDNVNVEWTVFI